MRPRDWLMLLVAIEGAGDGLDPVRLQKGMFLLAREGGLPAAERYGFVPYSYGPMSRAVYRDLDALVDDGLVERRPVPGYAWGRYVATPAGRARAAQLLRRAAGTRPSALAELRRIERRITALGFAALLADVYARYPRYAARSVFRRR